MVNMMGGQGRRKSLLDIISDPEKLKAQVKIHEEAILARDKATEDYKKSKIDALATIDLLDQKLAAHDKRKEQLDNHQKQLTLFRDQLVSDQETLEEQKKQFNREKERFEEQKASSLLALEAKTQELVQKQEDLDRRLTDLINRTAANDDRHYNLSAREASVPKREAFLIGIINQLKE